MGIEPTSPAWEAGALPLCYARFSQELVAWSRLQEPLTFTGSIIVSALLRVKEVPRALRARRPTLTSIVFLQSPRQVTSDADVVLAG